MINLCCIDKFVARREHSINEEAKANYKEEAEEEEDFGDGFFSKYQKILYELFEKPQSSGAAKFLSIWSILLVLISTIGMCINTFPWMQEPDPSSETP